MKSLDKKIIKRAERVFKGGANKNRLRILDYINRENETGVWMISQSLNLDFRNVSQHLARLKNAGLVEKQNIGRTVYHTLTTYGKQIIDFVGQLK